MDDRSRRRLMGRRTLLAAGAGAAIGLGTSALGGQQQVQAAAARGVPKSGGVGGAAVVTGGSPQQLRIRFGDEGGEMTVVPRDFGDQEPRPGDLVFVRETNQGNGQTLVALPYTYVDQETGSLWTRTESGRPRLFADRS